MILPDFVLLSRVSLNEKFTGIDSEEHCVNPQWFKQYPHSVTYNYNSRGFRDAEWPEDLARAVWCVGDSFTVGLGSPHSHAWPSVLQRKIHTRCINVSLDGGSNQWIARKIVSLSQSLQPRCVVVHWSYIHRRESSVSALTKTLDGHWREFYHKIKDPSWPDCFSVAEFDQLPEFIKQEIVEIHAGPAEHALLNHRLAPGVLDDENRRIYFDPACDESADVQDTINCIDRVHASGVKVIHSFIPGFATSPAAAKIMDHLDQLQCRYVRPFRRLDIARDGHHYDSATADFFTDQIIQLM
jgi:hypothetical protein